ncbi:hypothetical protein [Burkholderia plantarii]|uniref:hypothetical protein n=1 Tax=Burkholderia plantarii TaxID=41899 RepID=UPI000AE43A43|nr:hypothetical protein [Burkholderia plantarii]GLZ23136.1 hypothetical protein Bpla01_66640 [Burkholderia plantarii]
MALFNVWRDGAAMKTTVMAADMDEALDRFCARHRFIDHADYCRHHGIEESDINVEAV